MTEIQAESLGLGQRLNGYVVESVLGEGGLSTTYLARDPATGSRVTIREYFPRTLARRDTKNRVQPVSDDVAAQYAEGLARFIEKARNLAIFSDQKAGHAIASFEANGTAYLVMAYDKAGDPTVQPPTESAPPRPEPNRRAQTPARQAPMVSLEEAIHHGPMIESDPEHWREMFDGPDTIESTLAEPMESLATPAPPPSPSDFQDPSAGYVSVADSGPPAGPTAAAPPALAAYTPRPPGPRRVRIAAAFFAVLLLVAGSGWFVVDRLAGEDLVQGAKGDEVAGRGPLVAPAGPTAKAAKRNAADAKRAQVRPKKNVAVARPDFKAKRGSAAQPDAEQAFRRGHESFYKAADYAAAFKWYRKAAEQGHARAQFALGYMFDQGKGVERDPAAAIKWFRKAAEQGHIDSQYNIAFMYANGTGVKKDYGEGMKWFRRAAAQCDVASQANIGFMYEKGWGVPQDVAEAHFWYRLAVANFGKSSIKNDARLDRIATRADMAAKRTGKQLAAASKNSVADRVKAWTPAATKRIPAWCR
ncbi:MAG: Sel1-like repeat-containing protein kinase family protein [Pseudomonadota bacterium]